MEADFQYTVPTEKSYEAALEAVQAEAVAKGFRVQHVHDVQKTLADKGLDSEPYAIVEV